MTREGGRSLRPIPDFHLPLSPNIRGSLFMVVGMASFTMNDAITKAVSSEMNFGQVMLVRGLFASVLIAALAWHRGAMRSPRTSMMLPVALRVAAEVGGTIAFLTAIVNLPLANTAAIFQALPLAVTLGAALVFGEPVGWRRWLAIQQVLSAFSSSSGRDWKVLTATRCSRSARCSSSPCGISRPGRFLRTFPRCSSRS